MQARNIYMGHAARGGRGMFTHHVGTTTVELTVLVHSSENVNPSHFLRPLNTCKLQSISTLFILCIKWMYDTLTHNTTYIVCASVWTNRASYVWVDQMLYSSVYYLVTRRCNVTKILNIFHVTEISHVNSWITCYVVSQCIYVYRRICTACVAVRLARRMARYILAIDQLVSVSPSHPWDVSIPFDRFLGLLAHSSSDNECICNNTVWCCCD